MDEQNHDHEELAGSKFFWVTVLNILITIAEFIGGALSGSLSLISDGFHNAGDSVSIVFSYAASRISKRRQDSRNTFGYKRAEIIAAFLNSIALALICIFLIFEALKRITNPQPINGNLMLTIAVIGLVANLLSAFLLNSGSKNNLNMKATYLHILSDALSSIAIIFGGILIDLYNWTLADPIVTVIVAVYIFFESIPIIRQTFRILMQGAPNLNYEELSMTCFKLTVSLVFTMSMHGQLMNTTSFFQRMLTCMI